MAQVSLRTAIGASAADVWSVVREFGGIDKFLDAVESVTCEGSGVGAIRTITLQGGAVIVERLESLDDAARTLSYSIIDSPLPLAGYVATMAVAEMGADACELTWSSTFDVSDGTEADAKAIVEGVYTAGFDGLNKLLGG